MLAGDLGDGLVVSAIAVVNAWGDVVDPETCRVIAAPRTEDDDGFHSTVELMARPRSEWPQVQATAGGNTTIGVLATNASLNKEQANKLAERGQDGIALAVRPSTPWATAIPYLSWLRALGEARWTVCSSQGLVRWLLR